MKFVETNGFTDLGVGARLWRHESGPLELIPLDRTRGWFE